MASLNLCSALSLVFLTCAVYLVALVHALSGGTHVLPGISMCRNSCGSIPIKYPFGTGFGCGHPDFAKYVKCVGGALQFSTSTGAYEVTTIDYNTNIIIVSDRFMSTCSSMQNSGSFVLDPDGPFVTIPTDVFVLLGCSTTSPVFDPNQDLCDTDASHVCKGLYSCKGVADIGLDPNGPTSTCCVYDPPMGLGSGYQLDLPKLQCSSYACIYGYGEDEGDPNRWKYGISLQFNDTYRSDACKTCEATAGTCGFTGSDASPVCICRNGVNTTTNCYGQGYTWRGSSKERRVERFNLLGVFVFWAGLFMGSCKFQVLGIH